MKKRHRQLVEAVLTENKGRRVYGHRNSAYVRRPNVYPETHPLHPSQRGKTYPRSAEGEATQRQKKFSKGQVKPWEKTGQKRHVWMMNNKIKGLWLADRKAKGEPENQEGDPDWFKDHEHDPRYGKSYY